VGLRRLGAVAHRLEDLIGLLRDGALQSSADITDVCLQTVDALRKILVPAVVDRRRDDLHGRPLLARITQWIPEDLLEGPADGAEAPQKILRRRMRRWPRLPVHQRVERAPGEHTLQAKSVRISLVRLDQMMNSVGELVINRTRLVDA